MNFFKEDKKDWQRGSLDFAILPAVWEKTMKIVFCWNNSSGNSQVWFDFFPGYWGWKQAASKGSLKQR